MKELNIGLILPLKIGKWQGICLKRGIIRTLCFFGHLTLEKTLKAIYVKKQDETPPFSHNLVYLCEKAGLELQQNNLELLEEISDYNLESRYPDDKFSFFKRCTKGFTSNKLKQIEEIREWLLQEIQS